MAVPARIKFEGLLAYNKIGQQILDERKFSTVSQPRWVVNIIFRSPNLLTHSGWSTPPTIPVALDFRMWTSIDEKDYNWAANFSGTFGKEALANACQNRLQELDKKHALDVFSHVAHDKICEARRVIGAR